MPGPIINPQNIFGFPDPAQNSPSDSLFTTLYKKALGLVGGSDPQSQAISAGLPVAPLMAAETKLEPFLVNMYKQRLQQDPSLAYHPGLQGLPEFMEAFKQLNPTKKILGPGEEARASTTKLLEKEPTPPMATPESLPDVAKTAATGQKTPRTQTYQEAWAEKNPGGGASWSRSNKTKGLINRLSPDLIDQLREIATHPSTDTKFKNRAARTVAPDVSPYTLRELLIRLGMQLE